MYPSQQVLHFFGSRALIPNSEQQQLFCVRQFCVSAAVVVLYPMSTTHATYSGNEEEIGGRLQQTAGSYLIAPDVRQRSSLLLAYRQTDGGQQQQARNKRPSERATWAVVS